MLEAYRLTRKDGAPGVDGMMATDYEAKLPRRSLETVGDRFDHMEGSSSRTRLRHRSSHRLTNSAADSRSLTHSARRGLFAAYDISSLRR
ncbi:hypothetical protein ACVWW1_004613 [Bradyrhizobium sp. JR3.5]